MIAGRRARKRSLIRPNAIPATMAKTLSPMDGLPTFQAGSSELNLTTPLSPYAMPQHELTLYLRQLSSLYTAGILTDEEFKAARGRLMGS